MSVIDIFEDKGGICYKLFVKTTKITRALKYRETHKRFTNGICVIEKLNDRYIRICCDGKGSLKRGLEWLESLA